MGARLGKPILDSEHLVRVRRTVFVRSGAEAMLLPPISIGTKQRSTARDDRRRPIYGPHRTSVRRRLGRPWIYLSRRRGFSKVGPTKGPHRGYQRDR